MSRDLADLERTVLEAADAKALAAEVMQAAGHRSEFDAQDVLAKHPGLARFPSIVVDLAYEEFCRRMDAGKRLDPRQFARQFPAVADSLLKVLEVHEYLEEHPDAFTAESPEVWPQPGEAIAGFTLLREIGRGGSSRVFVAREQKLGNREVVVKVSRQANGEAARLGQLDHPHIMPVFSVRTESQSGVSIICMPYLGSATLADVLAETAAAEATTRRGSDVLTAIAGTHQRHRSPASDRERGREAVAWPLRRGSYVEALVEIGAELGEALDYAHRQGICHCDVKPSNVLLTAEGRALLLDFNLSLQRGGSAAIVGGTLPYMAPEQLQFLLAASPESLLPIDHRADLFSLGATLFQLLTGQLPFPVDDLPEDRAEAARQLIERQRNRTGLWAEVARVAGPEVAELIAACLAFDRDARPSTAEQVARGLRHYLRPTPRVRRWARQHRRAVAATAMVLALAGSVLALALALRTPYHERQYQAGLVCLDAGDYRAAIPYLDDVVEPLNDFTAEAFILRGWAKLKLGQTLAEPERSEALGLALADFERSWDNTPSPEAAASLAQCYAESDKPELARELSRRAIVGGMQSPAVLNNLACCLTRERESEEAAAALNAAIQACPELGVAHYNLAVIEFNQARLAWTWAGSPRWKGDEDAAGLCEAAAEEAFRSAIEHIEIARSLESRSGEMELAVARVYAAASTLGNQDEMLERAIEASFAAVERNLRPDRLRELALLAPQLRGSPVFQMLLAMPAPAEAAAPLRPTVDIFPAIRDRLARPSR